MRSTITNVPNTPAAHAAADRIGAPGIRTRRRGRGARGSNRSWHQDLPIERAVRFTLYAEVPREYPLPDYQRFTCTGVDKARGKLRVRPL